MFRAGMIAAATLATVPKRRYGEYPKPKPEPFPEHMWYVPNARYHHYKGDERTYRSKDGGVNGRVTYYVGGTVYSCSIRNWEQWVVCCTRIFDDNSRPTRQEGKA